MAVVCLIPSTGTWQFKDEKAKAIVRNADLVIAIDQIEQKKLI
jgi:hypothetical protein